jgi:ribonuclease HI
LRVTTPPDRKGAPIAESATRPTPAASKDELRRQAARLLAGYTGSVTKLPAGISGNAARPVIGNASSKLSADHAQMRPLGNVAKLKANRRSNAEHRASGERSPMNRAVPRGIVAFADGACEPNPGAGGWGFVVYRDGLEIHAESGGSDPTTNNIMELTGALRALEWIAAHLVEKQDAVRLFCDSMYVVNGCNDWRHGWKKKGWRRGVEKELANAELWKELDAALTITPIALEWCKGHAGIIGNERADELSLEGRASVLALKPSHLDMIRQQLDYSARGGV